MWSEDEEPDSTSPPLPTPTAISAPTSRGKRRLQSQLTLPPPEPRTLPEQTAFVSVKDTEQFTESEAPRSGYFTAKKKVKPKFPTWVTWKTVFLMLLLDITMQRTVFFLFLLRLCLLAQILLSQGLLIQRLFLLKLHFPCPWGLDKITSVGTNVLSNALE